jgi:large subunit ribosomal protein L24
MARRIRRIRVGDLVQVTAGADRGKQGKVIAVDAARGRVRVDKVRMQKHHVKPGRKIARSGGIIEQEGYIDASNVMLIDAESGRPSRVGVTLDEQGKRVRVFRKSGARVPTPAGR